MTAPDRSLVPALDLPYGEGEQFADQAAQVGVPTEVGQVGTGPAPGGLAPAPTPQPQSAPPSRDFDVLAGRTPTTPTFPDPEPPDRYTVLLQQMAQSPNPFYRDVAQQMIGGDEEPQ